MEFVFFMMSGKKNRHVSNQSKILRHVVQPQEKRTQEASVARALVQREHRDASKNGTSARTHIHTMCSLSRQATVNFVEKHGNRCIKAQDFEGLQGHSGIKDRQTMGNTPHNIQKAEEFVGQNGSVRQHTRTDW